MRSLRKDISHATKQKTVYAGIHNSDDLDAAILNLYHQGLSAYQVALSLEMADKSVVKRLVRLGVETERRYQKGSKRYNAKLTESDVRKIKKMLKQGQIQRVIAEEFGVSRGVIKDIKSGKSWKHVPEHKGKVKMKKVDRKINFTSRTKIIQEAIFRKHHHLEHLGIFTSEDLDKEVLTLYEMGNGAREIAVELATTTTAVHARLKKQGVAIEAYRKSGKGRRTKLTEPPPTRGR